MLQACPITLTVYHAPEPDHHDDNKSEEGGSSSGSDNNSAPRARHAALGVLSKVRLAIRLGRAAPPKPPEAAPLPRPEKPPADRLRRAVRRLKAVQKFTSRDAVLRKIRSAAAADAASGGGSLAALRALLASDTPLDELVRLSFSPSALAKEIRRIRAEHRRLEAAARRGSSAGSALLGGSFRASGSFSGSAPSIFGSAAGSRMQGFNAERARSSLKSSAAFSDSVGEQLTRQQQQAAK